MVDKNTLGLLDEIVDRMGDPTAGIPDSDPYGKVDYRDDLYDVFDVPTPTNPPKAFLWRVLVMPAQPRTMSKGGIALPNQVREAEEHLNYIGKVVSLGPLAGKSERYLNPEWVAWNEKQKSAPFNVDEEPVRWLWDVKVGDWILYGRYAGQTVWFKDAKLILINDDEILGVAPNGPVGFKVYAA